jgi:hypothetical protein
MSDWRACGVKWCLGMASYDSEFCAAHRVNPNFHPGEAPTPGADSDDDAPECEACEGSGLCDKCNGDGDCSECGRDCATCDGTGECDECGGTGDKKPPRRR